MDIMYRTLLHVSKRYSSSQASKLVKPPVALFGLEGSYTTAVYSAASKQSKLEAVEKDLIKISQTLETDIRFREFLVNPLIPVSQKKEILKTVATTKLGSCDVTVNLLHVLAENGRLKLLPQVAKSLIRVMQVSRGELVATVYTAKQIDASTQKDIESGLKGFTDKKLAVKFSVDPSIMGGIIVDFGGEHYIDMSIKSKMKVYSDLLQQAV